MIRVLSTLLALVFVLAACTVPTGPDGKPLKTAYRIGANDRGKLQFRMLDSVNALRQAQGTAPVTLNPALNAAAAQHNGPVLYFVV